ncbi:MAG TPA: signal peptidase II [Opitutales bacterium]|jgi:signal peptidase II|nr:signal peptidase II [Opitutales bacterium]
MSRPVQSFPSGEPCGGRGYGRFWAAFLAVLVADQLSKAWVRGHIPEGTYHDPPPIPVIDGFFYFVHVNNTGAAWSMFEHYPRALALLGAAALLAVFYFRKSLELHKPFLQYTFGLLCGGILGNLVDRCVNGSVVDFLDVHLPGYRYPAFNVADSGITVGVIIYLVYSFRDARPGRKEPEVEQKPVTVNGPENAAEPPEKPAAQ